MQTEKPACVEEKGISFSINRILQRHEHGKDDDLKDAIRHERVHETVAKNVQICSGVDERFHESMLPYPWQIIDKQPHRRIGHPYQSRAAPKRKKPRTTFSRSQIAELEELFTEKKYLTSSERQRVANYLSLSDCQVKTWFQNRRTKWKRETEEEKEEQRHALTRTMLPWPKERILPFPNYHHISCNLSKLQATNL
eukprot:Seg3307.1 transcript_id=Seg3307.1/GoldUCD/mRNA.D3Y31 product="T-cell leukemia homeobox protein 2" protein_id=Seg3307.1/GoldUCD/D3Y31